MRTAALRSLAGRGRLDDEYAAPAFGEAPDQREAGSWVIAEPQ